jgi:pyridoxamine 5'-phosphate oxidase
MNELPGWRRLLDQAMQAHAHLPQGRFVQLATVRLDGRPANRTVVFRDWLDGDRLLCTTDLRSEKVVQLRAQPWAEVCCYFTETRQQFRILGQVSVGTPATGGEETAVLARCWQDASADSRQSFTWPRPRAPRGAPSAFEQLPLDEPPAHFGILILDPREVDYLHLRPRPHMRRLYQRAQAVWIESEVNP